jgi:hypothetical protein
MAAMVAAASLSFTACTKSPKPKIPAQTSQVPEEPQMTQEEKQAAYKSTMKKVGAEIKRDANYKRLDLSTPELKNWFTDITYKLWNGEISRGQFIAMGLEKYPDRAYEFEVIANGLLSK